MECGERDSTRTSPCPTLRRRSRVRRRGRLSPSVMAACTGSNTACSRISLEEMIHTPCVPTLVLPLPRNPSSLDAVTIYQRPRSRYEEWYILFAFARMVYDALLCASTGCGLLRTLQIVEPTCIRAPIHVCSTRLMLVPCLARLGDERQSAIGSRRPSAMARRRALLHLCLTLP